MLVSHPINTDICIIGGGLGAVAAALTALDLGATVVLVAPQRWLGGQMSSQGVSALDEHRYIETFAGSPHYLRLRQLIRQRMATLYGITITDEATFNPGNAWVSNLCFFPQVAADAINALIAPYVASQQLTVLYDTLPIAVSKKDATITHISCRGSAQVYEIIPQQVIDASEQGDLLALANLAYVTGAEAHSDTGEHNAPLVARPHEIQGFTFGFAVEFCPHQSHIIIKPEGYASLRDRQPFTLTLTSQDGEARPFRMFTDGPTGLPPFWTYRRLWDGQQTTPATADIALINWNSNDYHHGTIIDVDTQTAAQRIDEAKRLSLAFLYWLQTEVPRDDGTGFGYPELKLRPDIMGTNDGLAMEPYVRESRRTPGLSRIVAEDLLVVNQPLARANAYRDSVGIGWYFMDLHPAPGNSQSMFAPTRPFQIPLGALIPPDCHNLMMGCKNIATTHLSNGSYRLHPVEWNIGVAAGMIAQLAILQQVAPCDVPVWSVQKKLLAQGHPVAWAIDVPPSHPAFAATQWLIINGVLGHGARAHRLTIACDEVLGADAYTILRELLRTAGVSVDDAQITQTDSWESVCARIVQLGLLDRD
jgi:hypothetical protein